jgi:HAMP domain-containing protein
MGTFTRAFRESLRFKVICLFLLAGVIPLGLVGVAVLEQTRAAVLREIRRGLEGNARLAAVDLAQEVDSYQTELLGLSQAMPVEAMDPLRAGHALQDFLRASPLFHKLRLYDNQGRLVAWAGGDPGESRTARVSDLKAKLPTAGHLLAMSAPDATGHQTMVLPVYRFDDETAVVGYLSATLLIRGPALQSVINDWAFDTGTSLYLLAADGSVLATTATGRSTSIRQLVLPNLGAPKELAAAPVSGWASILDIDHIVSISAVPALGVTVVLTRPYAQANAWFHDLLSTMGIYVLLGVFLAAVLGNYLAAGLVQSILLLTRSIERVARGELTHRIETPDENELGQAAAAFNQMSTYLHKIRLLDETWKLRRPQDPNR